MRASTTPEPRAVSRRRRAITTGVAAITVGICVTTPVVATTGDNLREGVRNGTATQETRIISRVAGQQYGTRQSNISTGANAGGAAIYGCRRPSRECTRHVNLDNGPAAAFVTKGATPFTVSGTGLVANLNADKLDGLDAAQIVAEARNGKAATAGAADVAAAAGTAQTANRAATVDTLTPAGKMAFVDPSASNADPNAARTAATEIPLFTRAPFTVYAKCFVDTTANTTLAEAYVRTTQSGAIFDGQTDLLDGDPAYLDTGTAETDRQIDTASSGTNSTTVDLDEDLSSLVAPDGTIVQWQTQVASKHGAAPGGDGPFGAGNRCGFAYTIIG